MIDINKIQIGDLVIIVRHPKDTYGIEQREYNRYAGRTAKVTRIWTESVGIDLDNDEYSWADYLLDYVITEKCWKCNKCNTCDKEVCKYE